jgi:hypothetical protein
MNVHGALAICLVCLCLILFFFLLVSLCALVISGYWTILCLKGMVMANHDASMK